MRFVSEPISNSRECLDITISYVASSLEVIGLDWAHPAFKSDRFTAVADFVIVRGGGNAHGRGAGLYFDRCADVQQGEAFARQPRLQKLRDR